MAIVQISKLQQRSGNLVDLPQLDEAELGFATDAKRLFVGKESPAENIEVLTSYSNISFSQIDGAVGNLNINASSIANGQVLTYTGSEWTNRGGSAGGIITLGDVSNVSIEGGAIGYVLETDGVGNLSWTPKSVVIAFINNVTKTDPAVVTTTEENFFVNGSEIVITDVLGMTQLNGNTYYANVLTSNTFSLYTDSALTSAVNSTLYTTYTANGRIISQITGGGGTSVSAGGSPTQVQFNSSGVLAGSSGLTWSGTTLAVVSNISVGNLSATSSISGSTLTSTIATGTAPLTVSSTTRVSNLNVSHANVSDFGNVTLQTTGTYFPTFVSSSATGNRALGANANLSFNVATGNLVTTILTATGNVSGGNITTAGVVAATGNVSGGNITTAGVVTATGNVSGANITTAGVVAATGNVSGANITTTGVVTAIGNVSGGNITTAGVVTATGNVSGGNITTAGNVSGANITTAGVVTATGNVSGGNITTAGVVSATGNISGANIAATGNVSGANITTTGVVAATGNISGANIAATGNVSGANITTAGVVSATGNVSGGNITTVGVVSATGNVSGANITTAGVVTATGNVSGANITTTGVVTATGNVSGGNIVTVNTVSGSLLTGTLTTAAQPNVTSVSASFTNLTFANAQSITGNNLSLTTGSNTNPGNITGNWTLTTGSRLQATYADLAEYYSADKNYEPGTVLEFGGENEVTVAEDGSTRIAGVVSTDPAYAMNAKCPGIAVAIALQGRVPCKVKGKIRKGDMLISGGNGFARPSINPTIGTVLGKSLEDFDGLEGIIEVAVGRL